MSNIMSAATRIRTVYISLIRGEESHRLAEYAARWLQDDDLLAPDLPEPATLTKEEDFAAAPIGTVILHPWGAAIKQSEDNWSVTGDDMARHHGTVGDDDEYPSTVLRWGKQTLTVPHAPEVEFDEDGVWREDAEDPDILVMTKGLPDGFVGICLVDRDENRATIHARPVEEIREFAHALLVAANHAEGQQK